MPAQPERTVLERIPDVEDREVHVSRITWPDHPEWPTQIEIADYIPSTGIYGRGYLYDERLRTRVIAGQRKAGQKEIENPSPREIAQ